jgi:outer membrane receptor protein involved in Fe transport
MKAHWVGIVSAVGVLVLGAGEAASGQAVGRVEGTVTARVGGDPLGSVGVSVGGTSIATRTNAEGRYVLARVPEGPQTIVFRWLGFQPQQATVTVTAGGTQTVDIALEPQVINLADIVVEGASRSPERIVDAPAAVAIVSPITLRNVSITGQAPRALNTQPGVDLVQSGMNDFNVNARGFNSSLNRRVLVLQDGRDLAIAFLGSQEWNALSQPLDDLASMEMVRGPGSALYGANAFSGVIDIRTPPARDVVGTKITLGGGSESTIRGDFRHAGVAGQGRFGYRFNVGYYRSNSWSRSRTALDGSDAASEYDMADPLPVTGVPSCTTVGPNCLAVEMIPLAGQSRDTTTGVASGPADKLQNIYGSARLDYYLDNGSMFTVDGGAAQVENEVFVTGIGRVQVLKALRPWARAAFASERFNLFGWYSGRKSIDPQEALSTGADLEEASAIFHVEGQYNQPLASDRLRLVLGASARSYNVNTKGTLMAPANDDRSDGYYSGYGQIEWSPADVIKFVAAGRVDGGDLFDTRFSPKGAVVVTPAPNHAIRATVNRAFMLPNYSEFFLNVQAAATPNPGTLQNSLAGYYATLQNPQVVGPQLAAVMSSLGLPAQPGWGFGAQTPVMALGNASLEPEEVTSWEIGYKGEFGGRAYIAVDFYYSVLNNFVTDLLFGVNPAQYPPYDVGAVYDPTSDLATIDAILAGAGLPADNPLRAANTQLGDGYATLTNTPGLTVLNGTPAIALSYAQAGKATEKGIEFGFGYGFTPELRVDASYTFFDFDIDDPGLTGQTIVPNTPKNKGTISLGYTGIQAAPGFDAAISAKFIDAYDWNAGVYAGRIPSSQLVDIDVGYRFRRAWLGSGWRVYVSATNVLNQEVFQLYGGSVNGARVLGGVTVTY